MYWIAKDFTLNDNTIKSHLLQFITRNFMVDESEIKLDESLIDQGIIDSFGLIEITSYIEDKYSFEITDAMMNRDNLGSVIKIVNFINNNSSSL